MAHPLTRTWNYSNTVAGWTLQTGLFDQSTLPRSIASEPCMLHRLAGLFLAFALIACLPQPSTASAEGERKAVLYLSSYHNGYSWSDDILKGIRNVLEPSPHRLVFQVEYMDSKKFLYKETEQTLYRLYRDKFRNTRFDVILASDNAALDFLLRYRDELFPGVPVVFCGLNDVKPGLLRGRNMTGVLENYDVGANIELALKFNPHLRRMVIIGDDSVTGAAIRNQVLEQLVPFRNRIEVEEWTDYRLDQMLSWVKEQPPDTFFYFVPIYRDIDGQFYSAEELLQKVRHNSRAPLYSNWSFLLGHGIVGGKLISGTTHGEMAARLALRVLAGEKANDIPMIEHAEEHYMFDNSELRRLFINRSLLPSESLIINEPSRFYELNKQIFWTIIISLVLLFVTLVLLVLNILEKRRVEGKIKDQLSFLRLLTDTIPLPVYSKDADGRIRECNIAFQNFFGVERDAVLGRFEWQAGDERLAMLRNATDSELLRSPGVATYETTIPGPDHEPHSMIMHKATYRNAKGGIAGLVGVVVDYTDRKRAEDSLRSAEEKYRSIFESSPLGIFRLSSSGQVCDANPAFARMIGYDSPCDLLLKGGAAVKPIIGDLAIQQAEHAGILTRETEVERADGTHGTMNLTLRVQRGESGELRLVEGYAEDVTKRRETERALSASQRMLRLVLDNIPQFVYWTDRDLRFIGANRSFLSFFGFEGGQSVSGLSMADILGDQRALETVQEANVSVIDTGQPRYQSKLTLTSRDGDTVWLETSRVPLMGEKGEVVGLLTTAEDVTQRIQLERQLLQSQKMEAIGTLAGGISHDFNNILTSIINSIELAIDDIAADSLTFTDLMRALKAAQRGSRLVKQILTFSRPSVEGFTTIDLNEVLSEALVLIKASMPRNIQVRTAVPPEPSVTRADPTQLHQVIMNLCTNSFHALRENGGILDINLEQEVLGPEESQSYGIDPGSWLHLTVSDNGPGIPQEILDKIFDPFFTTKGKTEGTGLGLAVVHGIIKGHRGAVRVSSQPYRRTAFEILLPMQGQGTCAVEAADIEFDHAVGYGRILFVEDDDDQLHTIPRVLESLGYTVRPFKNPLKALEAFTEHPDMFDLVLTDFDMPEANGLELARKIGDIAPHIPVILVSGREVAAEGAACAGNIRTMIHKPYNRNILADALRRALSRPGSM